MRQESQSDVWMLRLRPRTRPTIPGNSTEKAESQVKQVKINF
jgi:hypothetical protein